MLAVLKEREDRKMEKMTVNELMAILKQYNGDNIVTLDGGEDGDGEFAVLYVNDDVVMEK